MELAERIAHVVSLERKWKEDCRKHAQQKAQYELELLQIRIQTDKLIAIVTAPLHILAAEIRASM